MAQRAPGTYAVFNTSEGNIVCRLFEKEAPKTVANFTELAEGKREWTHPNTRVKSKTPLYNGTIFHRVIPDFMIQGGDPQGTGMGGPGYQFEDETKGSPHRFDKAGKLAMANASNTPMESTAYPITRSSRSSKATALVAISGKPPSVSSMRRSKRRIEASARLPGMKCSREKNPKRVSIPGSQTTRSMRCANF